MIHRGKNVEVITDVLPDEQLSLAGLRYYHRSGEFRAVKSSKRENPYMCLKDVEAKPLWKFLGHECIPDRWFSEILLYDTGQYDLVIKADLARFVDDDLDRDDFPQYVSGEFLIKPGKRLVVGEPGLVWADDPDKTFSQTLIPWEFVTSLKVKR